MNYLKLKLIQYLVKNLLVAINADEIITFTNQGTYLKGRRLTNEEVFQLKDDANSFEKSFLWQVMTNEVRFLSNDRMFEKSAVEGNSVFGRAMLYNLNILEQFIKRCKNL